MSSSSTTSATSRARPFPYAPWQCDISGFQRGTIIDAVSCHSDNFLGSLQRLDDLQFMRWAHSCKDIHFLRKRFMTSGSRFAKCVESRISRWPLRLRLIFANGVRSRALSPVIMTVFDTRLVKSSNHLLDPERTGSAMPTNPTHVRSPGTQDAPFPR